MHRQPRVSTALSLLLLTALGPLGTGVSAQTAPNVVVIISDDAGYADFGFMNGLSGTTSQVPTPNLDVLANRGVTFSRAYVAQSCQPTRAAIVTGGYQNRIGSEVVGNTLTSPTGVFDGVPVESTTIWERMKLVGYTTSAVGKWHIGAIGDASPSQLGNRPQNQGVDEFYGIWDGSRTYNVGNTSLPATELLREAIVDAGGNKTDTVVEATHGGEYITNTFGDYAVNFIANHYNDANPFFLYQSFTAPHTPMHNSPDFNDPRLAGLSGIRKQYASMMLTMDKEIGRILDRLEDPNGDGNNGDSITDNTLIVFVNDNGGAHAGSSSPNGADNGIFRGGKGTPYEGGIRVPMIIAGAGVTVPGGTVYDAPVHGVDILPTVFGAAGGTFGAGDNGIDGVNLLPYINGTITSDPHQVLVNRHRKQFTVVKGNWTLVNSGGSSTASHQLFNLATDVSQTTNVAGANPAIVEELRRDLTDHEAVFDKQRFAILGQTAENTINLFDHFTFKPSAPVPGGEASIIDGSIGNGDFEAGGLTPDVQTYAQTAHWSNASGAETINFTNTSQTAGSPQPNSRAGMPFQNRKQVNDSGHTVTVAGETFNLSYAFGRGGGGWSGDESLRTFLFTASAPVDGNLTAANMSEFASVVYDIPTSPQWTTFAGDAFYTTTAADIGKTLYFGMELSNPAGSDVFPRIDLVRLTRTGSGTTTPAVTNWSSNGAWFEGGTSNVETMFNSDAFAGAVLEFPTTNAFSYISNNDMVRETGLEFMMNKIILSGSFAGAESQFATIQGNDVLFTNDLDGVGPQIAVDASNSGGAGYSYAIDLNLVMYNDLTITGDGDVSVTINGQIRDYFTPRNLIKSGSSTVVLTGNNSHAGNTVIAGGTLALSGGATLSNTPNIEVQNGATLDVSATASGGLTLGTGQTLKGTGTVNGNITTTNGASVSPGSSFGRLSIAGNVTHASGANFEIELGPGTVAGTDYDQLAVSGQLDLAGGNLTVLLDAGFMPSSGDEFDILNFTTRSGNFGAVNLPALSGALVWSTTDLLTTGQIRVVLPGDFNFDNTVDAADYVVWRKNPESFGGQTGFDTWRANFGATGAGGGASSASAVPEPACLAIVLVLASYWAVAGWRDSYNPRAFPLR